LKKDRLLPLFLLGLARKAIAHRLFLCERSERSNCRD
jgi:hypothetical protein